MGVKLQAMRRRFGRRADPGTGKTADRFESLLLAALGEGWGIKFIDPVSGFWKRADVMRVEGQLVTPEGRTTSFGCWDTMSNCVRHGVGISFEDPYMVEAYALKAKK